MSKTVITAPYPLHGDFSPLPGGPLTRCRAISPTLDNPIDINSRIQSAAAMLNRCMEQHLTAIDGMTEARGLLLELLPRTDERLGNIIRRILVCPDADTETAEDAATLLDFAEKLQN